MATKTLDQIRIDNPLTEISQTGTEETFLVSQNNVTKAGFMSLLRTWVLEGIDSDSISDATAVGRAVLTAVDAEEARDELGITVPTPAAAVEDLDEYTDLEGVITSFNELLANLRAAGLLEE